MTHVYKDDMSVPVTIVEVPDNYVVSKRFDTNKDKWLVSVGIGENKKAGKRISGQFKNVGKVPKQVKQFWVSKNVGDLLEVGQLLNLGEQFKDIKTVSVCGKSKGKGFASVIKRWGFKEGPETRGQGTMKRHPGSIGAQGTGRVFAGKKMAGRMGGDSIKLSKVKVVEVQNNLILLKGGLPGSRGSCIYMEINN